MKRFFSSTMPFLLGAALLAAGVLYVDARNEISMLREETAELSRRIGVETENAARALSNALNDMQNSLGKLDAAGSREQHARLLADVWRLSGVAGSALERLSLSHADSSKTAQFLTRAGDYAFSLLERVQSGQLPMAQDREQLNKIRSACGALQEQIDGQIDAGTLPAAPVTAESYYTASQSAEAVPQYPSLLYDGPFSESSENVEAKGLPQETVTEAEAKSLAEQQFSKTDWQFDGRCEGAIVTFDFSGGNGESLSITERGGKALYWMTQPTGNKADAPSDAESKRMDAAAQTYLEEMGFLKMHPSYAQYYAGSVVLNYAAVQDGVVLYADLIKVYVDRETAEVIGFDARNYYSHHIKRMLPLPALTEEDAKNALSLNMEPEAITPALIPKSPVKEVLCYECKGTVNGTFFLVYINAQTGAEEEIFAVINTEEGDLIV